MKRTTIADDFKAAYDVAASKGLELRIVCETGHNDYTMDRKAHREKMENLRKDTFVTAMSYLEKLATAEQQHKHYYPLERRIDRIHNPHNLPRFAPHLSLHCFSENDDGTYNFGGKTTGTGEATSLTL